MNPPSKPKTTQQRMRAGQQRGRAFADRIMPEIRQARAEGPESLAAVAGALLALSAELFVEIGVGETAWEFVSGQSWITAQPTKTDN